MAFLIDSDWTADFLAGKPPAVALVQTLLPSGMAISVVAYVELMEGILGSRRQPALQQGFAQFLQGVGIIDLDRAIADRAATIRLDLRRQERQVNERALDILIVATAIEHGLTLVTRNTRDYADIPGLRLYQDS